VLGIHQHHRQAVGGLYGEKKSRDASYESVAYQRLLRQMLHYVDRVTVYLLEGDQFRRGFSFAGKRSQKTCAILLHGLARIHVRKPEVECLAAIRLRYSAKACAEAVYEPRKTSKAAGAKDLKCDGVREALLAGSARHGKSILSVVPS
jgi:hypothetical protein